MAHPLDYLMPDAPSKNEEGEAPAAAEPKDNISPEQNAQDAKDEATRWTGGEVGATAALLGSGARHLYGGLKSEAASVIKEGLKNAMQDLLPSGNANTTLEKSEGPGRAINNYTLSLMKSTPDSQTISEPEAQDILSPEEAQAKLKENVKNIRNAQRVYPSAGVVSSDTGLMGNTTIWQDPLTEEIHRVPVISTKDASTGKVHTVADPAAIDALIKNRNARLNAPTQTATSEPSFGSAVRDFAGGAGRVAGDVGYGLLHGVNALTQAQEAVDTSDKSPVESGLHGISALGSAADIASNLMPEIWRHGVRKYISPLSVAGAGAADIAQGYSAATEPKQPTESQADYKKRVYTGQMKIPSTIAKTAIGLINPIAGMASFSPPLSVDYAKTHPKQVQKWVDTGMYDNPESIMSGVPMRH
jgi:hypothetical protein